MTPAYSTKKQPISPANIFQYEPLLSSVTVALILLGLIAVASASMEISLQRMGGSLSLFNRQLVGLAIGLSAALVILYIPLNFWYQYGALLLILAFLMLLSVFIPGLGVTVNGSQRWINLGLVNFQPSEIAKIFCVIYLAGYLVRRESEVKEQLSGFAKPILLIAVFAILLLLEPDYGSTVVISMTMFGMLFLAGVKLRYFVLTVMAFVFALGLLVVIEPYRMQRVLTFLNPWDVQFDAGYQLTQALIAFGRGEWFGVGIGSGIQKLFYLPEAHTDFLFAVLAEEMGLVGAMVVIVLFACLICRLLCLGFRLVREGNAFQGYLVYGLGLLLGLQALINFGVNTGLLPTKGLVLPLMSYGKSSLVANCLLIALVLRASFEARTGKTSSA